jgi:hypothetical protein
MMPKKELLEEFVVTTQHKIALPGSMGILPVFG